MSEDPPNLSISQCQGTSNIDHAKVFGHYFQKIHDISLGLLVITFRKYITSHSLQIFHLFYHLPEIDVDYDYAVDFDMVDDYDFLATMT